MGRTMDGRRQGCMRWAAGMGCGHGCSSHRLYDILTINALILRALRRGTAILVGWTAALGVEALEYEIELPAGGAGGRVPRYQRCGFRWKFGAAAYARRGMLEVSVSGISLLPHHDCILAPGEKVEAGHGVASLSYLGPRERERGVNLPRERTRSKAM